MESQNNYKIIEEHIYHYSGVTQIYNKILVEYKKQKQHFEIYYRYYTDDQSYVVQIYDAKRMDAIYCWQAKNNVALTRHINLLKIGVGGINIETSYDATYYHSRIIHRLEEIIPDVVLKMQCKLCIETGI